MNEEKPADVRTDEVEFETQLIPQQARRPVAPVVPSPFQGADKAADLGNYSLRAKIGAGGMGVVYLAVDKRLGRYVAIKRLKKDLRSDNAIRRRFLHEAKAAASLNNVHIVHIYSIGEDADGPYIVMEYVEGALPKTDPDAPCPPQTLEHYVEGNGPFSLEDGTVFLLKIGHAIEAAHAAGVIHRDLKPSNVLMDSAGEPKIVDFGLARLTLPGASTDLTVAGDKFISIGYGAPEQETDAAVSDERADVYGLGALFYFILTGKNPRYFREEDLPVSVRPLVCKALETDRDERFQSVAGFNAALKIMLAESKTERPTVKTTWRCKWCDTINPLSKRFCGECGWDGREQCRECGADQQVGIQFCGVCGANARDYENAIAALRKLKGAVESRQYDWAVNYASQPLAFEPVGPNGRDMLNEFRTLGSAAQNRLRRRDQLSEIIGIEMSAENYERAKRFIEEYRTLSPTKDAFEEELDSIPEKTRNRDCLRIAKAFASKDWQLGERLLVTLPDSGGQRPAAVANLWRTLRRHKRRVLAGRVVAAIIAVCLLYVLLLPPMIQLGIPGKNFTTSFSARIFEMPRAGVLLRKYAGLWGMDEAAMSGNSPEKSEQSPPLTAQK